MTVDDRLKKMGVNLPLLPEPNGTFVHAAKTGNQDSDSHQRVQPGVSVDCSGLEDQVR